MSRTRMHVWPPFGGLAMGGEPMRSAAAGHERVHPHARIALDRDRRPPARRRVAPHRAPPAAAPPPAVGPHAAERRGAPAPAERVTYLVRLRGLDAEGLGEDVGGDMLDEQGTFLAAAGSLALAGEWTLGAFLDHVAALDLWPEPPEWDMARRWRRWAFESAALDLALAQAGLGVGEAPAREPAPVRFVNSLGLGDPPVFATVGRRLERYPALRFKL